MTSRTKYSRLVPALLMVGLLLGISAPAAAQAIIKVNDKVNMKFGILLQGWADWNQDAASGGYAQNLFLRRARIIVAGQVAPGITFFAETDNPNLGKATKALGSGLILQDAFLEWKLRDEFSVQGGLILIPFCRNCLQSAASLLSIDYGSYSFLNSSPSGSTVGRDTGFQARGLLVDKHLEYRVGAFQGARETGSRNPLRVAGRLQYNVFDVEPGFFYTGTYLGKKKVLAIGTGIDSQQDYMSYTGDVFFDWPLAGGNGITVQADYIHWDGGVTYTTLAKQNDFMAEAGFYIGSAKVQPFLRYENQSFDVETATRINTTKYQLGLAWYPFGYNFNIKAAYGRNDPKTGTATNQFSVQMQAFYF